MNIAKKETPKDKLLFGIPTSTKLIYMMVYDMWKYNTSYFQYHSTFEYKLLDNK